MDTKPNKNSVPGLTNIPERSFPNNINAEAAVLSAMLIDFDIIHKAVDMGIKEQFFYRTSNKKIFRTILELYEEGEKVDILILMARLERANLLDSVGGAPYLNEIANVVVSGSNFEYHYKIMFELATKRNLIIASHGIIESCYQDNKSIQEIATNAEHAIAEVNNLSQLIINTKFSIPEATNAAQSEFNDICSGKNSGVIKTGFIDIDKRSGGFHPGELIIIAGRPGMGKTTLSMNISMQAALNGHKVKVYTMEQIRTEVANIYTNRLTYVNPGEKTFMDWYKDVTSGHIHKEIRDSTISWINEKYDIVRESMKGIPLAMDDKSSRNVYQLSSDANCTKETEGLDIAIIDYIGLMLQAGEKEIDAFPIITRQLKILAKDLGIPVVVLAQINRECEKRDDKRPLLHDLKSSGSLEQDANAVYFVYRDEYYNPESEDAGVMEVISAKMRGGCPGTDKLTCAMNRNLLGNYSDRKER